MSFAIPRYREPDFAALGLERAPDVKLVPAERDGVMPRGYHATTLFPEYYHIGGRWVLAEDSRMDCVAVVRDGAVSIVEFRNVRAGELVVVGRTEDGSEGIYVHPNCFVDQSGEAEAFAFRTGRSRETAYSIDYDGLYDLLRHEREHGNILWVMGPACSFDADSRAAFAALVRDGFVNGLMAGNALATHDLEAGYLGTALGQDVYTQQAHFNGHYNLIDGIDVVIVPIEVGLLCIHVLPQSGSQIARLQVVGGQSVSGHQPVDKPGPNQGGEGGPGIGVEGAGRPHDPKDIAVLPLVTEQVI